MRRLLGPAPSGTTDAVTKGFVDTADAATLASAKSYADSQDDIDLAAAKSYADGRTPAASTTVSGISRLATTAEGTAGSLATVSATPASVKAYADAGDASTLASAKTYADQYAQTLASTTSSGIIRVATQAETNAGSATTIAVSPATMKSYVDSSAATTLASAKSYSDQYALPARLGPLGQDVSGTDLNNVISTGFYRGSSMTNSPNGTGWWYILVQAHDTGSWHMQTVTGYTGTGTNRQYVRQRQNGTWGSWVESAFVPYVDAGDAASLASAKSYADAGDALQVTAAAAGNGTVYAKNGSGTVIGIGYGTSGTASNAIPQRQSNGQIAVPATPAATTDAASKSYVDAGDALQVTAAAAAANQAHVKDSSGNETGLGYDKAASNNTLAQRSATGTLEVATPTATTHAATKAYVDAGDALQVTSAAAGASQVHAKNASGVETGIAYSASANANQLVQRDGSAQVAVPQAPTQTNHATSKSYVDSNFAAVGRSVLAGTGLQGGGTLAADRTLSLTTDSVNGIAGGNLYASSTLFMTTSTPTATINAFLAQGGIRYLRGTCVLTSSLIIPSNTQVDAFGADITGATTDNILQNAAAVPSRTVTTGQTTAGSTSIVATGANFSSTDVGRQVEVVAAGPNSGRSDAPGSWYGTVVSITSATTAVLSTPANLAGSNLTVYIYGARDYNIGIRGGIWRPQNKNSLSQQQTGHGFRLRRLDNLTIADTLLWGPNVPQTGGQYAISVGDVSRVLATNLSYQDVNSDGFHVQGPANAIVIENVEAVNSGDDLVAFTAVDGQTYTGSRLGDTEGDIYDVEVHNVTGYGVLSHLKIAGGQGPAGVYRTMTRFNCEGFYGVTKGNSPINITNYAGATTFSGRIANVHAVSLNGTAAAVNVTATNTQQLVLEDIHWPSSQGVPSSGVINIAGVAKRVIVRNVHFGAVAGVNADLCPAVWVNATSVDYLEVDGSFNTDQAQQNFIAVQINSSVTMKVLKVSRHVAGASASGNAIYFTGSNWNIASIHIDNVNRSSGSWIDGTGTSTNNSDIVATNCVGGSAWILLRQPANINISSCIQMSGGGGAIRLIGTTASAAITCAGSNRNATLVTKDGSQNLRVVECICIGVDQTIVNVASSGDVFRANNSMYLRSGSAWKTL